MTFSNDFRKPVKIFAYREFQFVDKTLTSPTYKMILNKFREYFLIVQPIPEGV